MGLAAALGFVDAVILWRGSFSPASAPQPSFDLGFVGNPLRAMDVPTNAVYPSLNLDGSWVLAGHLVDMNNFIRNHGETISTDLGQPTPQRLVVVSLGSQPTFGNAIRTISSLRTQRICSVAIAEAGEPRAGYAEVSGMTIC